LGRPSVDYRFYDIAASNQCSNCGQIGHFRNRCPNPKNPSLEHWHAAKKQFRAENPEEKRKLEEKWKQRKEWQLIGKTFYVFIFISTYQIQGISIMIMMIIYFDHV